LESIFFCDSNLVAYPKSQSLTLPLINLNSYISDHDILKLDISVNKTLLVHVSNPMEQLSQDLNNLFFFKNTKFSLQIKE